jgi:hypothetical protein
MRESRGTGGRGFLVERVSLTDNAGETTRIVHICLQCVARSVFRMRRGTRPPIASNKRDCFDKQFHWCLMRWSCHFITVCCSGPQPPQQRLVGCNITPNGI